MNIVIRTDLSTDSVGFVTPSKAIFRVSRAGGVATGSDTPLLGTACTQRVRAGSVSTRHCDGRLARFQSIHPIGILETWWN